jgi:hypothetical protein
MKHMRKLLVVLTLLLIIAAVLPGAAGYRFKQQYLSLLAADSAKITVVEYHEYWLSSDAVVTVNLDAGQKQAPGPSGVLQTLTLNQHITHGPYIKNDETGKREFALALIATQAHLDKSFETKWNVSDNGILQVNTWVSFFDKYTSDVSTPIFAFNLPNQNHTNITWQGMRGNIEADVVSNELKTLKSDFAAGPLSIQGVSGSFTMNSLQSQGERDCDENTLCSGTGSLSVPLMVSSTAEHSFKISGFNLTTHYGVDAQDNYNGDFSAGFARYDTPEFLIGPMQFKVTVSNLNAGELKKMVDISRQASASMGNGEDLRANQIMLIAQYNDVLPHLVRANSAIVQSASIKTSYGSAVEHAKIFWPPKTALPLSATDFTKANFNLSARAATSLVDQVIGMIDEKNANMEPATAPTAAPTSAPAPSSLGDTAKQSFETSTYLLIGQGLSQDEEKILIDMQKKNVTKQTFNSYVDSRVVLKAIPANLAETIKQNYSAAAMNNPQQNVAALAGANKQLDDWVNQNKITSDTRTKLIALQKQHLSPEIYGASINDIVHARRLPQDLAIQLKAQYAASGDSASGLGEDNNDVSAGNTPAAATVVQASGETRLQFDSWIRSGYVIQDKNDYVVDMVYQDGVLKVNGIVVKLEAQDQVPALPAQ